MSLMLHCGAMAATRDEVLSVRKPRRTQTWHPVGYKVLLRLTFETLEERGWSITGEHYGLNKGGGQLFGLLALQNGSAGDTVGAALGLRASVDKSLANALAGGTRVFVCDNLAFSGDSVQVLRKNTTGVMRDLGDLIRRVVFRLGDSHERMASDLARMRRKRMSQRRGYELLGAALGEKVLTTTQMRLAMQDWREPRHPEFKARNLYSLYNCVTEGLKAGSPGGRLERQTRAHRFFEPFYRPA